MAESKQAWARTEGDGRSWTKAWACYLPGTPVLNAISWSLAFFPSGMPRSRGEKVDIPRGRKLWLVGGYFGSRGSW